MGRVEFFFPLSLPPPALCRCHVCRQWCRGVSSAVARKKSGLWSERREFKSLSGLREWKSALKKSSRRQKGSFLVWGWASGWGGTSSKAKQLKTAIATFFLFFAWHSSHHPTRRFRPHSHSAQAKVAPPSSQPHSLLTLYLSFSALDSLSSTRLGESF